MNASPLAVQTFGLSTLSDVFMTVTRLAMRQPLKLGDLWAALSLVGARYFIFRS